MSYFMGMLKQCMYAPGNEARHESCLHKITSIITFKEDYQIRLVCLLRTWFWSWSTLVNLQETVGSLRQLESSY